MVDTSSSAKFFNPEFIKDMMPASSLFPFDMRGIMETQRKNFQAFAEAQQRVVESFQTMAQRQAEILTQIVEDNTTLARQIMTDGTPEEKVSRQADIVRQSYERSFTGINELSDMMVKSNRETGEIISKRVTASLSEFKTGLEKTKEKMAA